MSEKEFNKLLDQCVGCARVNSDADFCPNCPLCHKQKSGVKKQQKSKTKSQPTEVPYYRDLKPACRSKRHFSR